MKITSLVGSLQNPMQEKVIATFSNGIANNKTLQRLLPNINIILRPSTTQANNILFVVGWGMKANTQKAQVYAKRFKLPYIRLEDGFIHSLGQGVLGYTSCSLILDNQGIYYNANTESELEKLIKETHQTSDNNTHTLRANQAIKRLTQSNITKYNHSPSNITSLNFSHHKKNILVIDQTAGDMSLKYGGVNKQTFLTMFNAALSENPDASILVKTHPDVLTGKKQGNLTHLASKNNVTIIAKNINPLALLKQIDHVYTATSQLGFEALLLNKKVSCFGTPFYAGWGLTDDRADKTLKVFSRRKKTTLSTVFYAAYIRYSYYIHPDKNTPCELEDIITYFEQQHLLQQKNTGHFYCFGILFFTQHTISTFLQAPQNKITFVKTAKEALKKGFNTSSHIISWGRRGEEESHKLSKHTNVPVWHIEDGFIRSIGLGSDFNLPASLVIDTKGIYYDPNIPSDLEHLLETYTFTDIQQNRAQHLQQQLTELAISKYNLGLAFDLSCLPEHANNKTIILIPGQVENDMSIMKGTIDIRTNSALIKTVRKTNPDAFIIYKPHPDVLSGNRIGQVNTDTTNRYCDFVAKDIKVTDCLELADEVHTMTSLVGIEGLFYNCKVYCYGIPFYAGWGLTVDKHSSPRRTRRLTLAELIAGTYILYPRYINWQTEAFSTPEYILTTLHIELLATKKTVVSSHPLMRKLTKMINITYGLLRIAKQLLLATFSRP